ncbi:MAG: biotin/lipoyl-containing protein [Gemmatimonadota bacterium]
MRYHVAVGERTYEVEVDGDSVRLDGREVEVDLASAIDSPVGHLMLDGRSWTVVAEPGETAGSWLVALAGSAPAEVEVVDDRTLAIRALTQTGAGTRGPEPLKAPMPGLIVRVEVGEGESVSAGQAVIVMEAMKMQNELRAAAAGVVRRVAVEPGAAVERGATLVEFAEGGS